MYRTSDPLSNADAAKQTLAAFDELGLGDSFTTARADLATVDQMLEATKPPPATVPTVEAEVVDQLSHGKITAAEAATRLGEAKAADDTARAALPLLHAAAGKVSARAWREFKRRGDGLIHDLLAPKAAESLTKMEKAAAKLDGVADADQAAEHGRGTAIAWAQLVAAYRDWRKVQELAKRLRKDRVLPLPGHAVEANNELPFTYRHPELAPKQDGPLALLDAIAGGAEPCVLTGAERDRLWREEDEAIRAEQLKNTRPADTGRRLTSAELDHIAGVVERRTAHEEAQASA